MLEETADYGPPQGASLSGFLPVRTRSATQVLKRLKADSATGPDHLATKVLKKCARPLGRPVAKLARLLLNTGRWPKSWRLHWVFPLYKKRSVYDPENYRGIHLSSQLSKVMERLFSKLLLPFLEKTAAYGKNQFAYCKKRGCRDALALNTLNWLWALAHNEKVALYCSDVSGAFDKVSTEKLVAKLRHKGVREPLLKLLSSWLEERDAVVVVEGVCSRKERLTNMVFQGTVLGPPLWNTFFADASPVVQKSGFRDTVFADDLNCDKVFTSSTSNVEVFEDLKTCQNNLHKWGASNQVTFDSKKESFHVLHRRFSVGKDFQVLGVMWDTKLLMDVECEDVGSRANQKLTALLRCKRFYSTADLVRLYKAHVLPILEFPTAAIYHATNTNLKKLDMVQNRFLREVGLSREDAFTYFRLAPLQTRRDIAALGLIHRTVLGRGPSHFKQWFFPTRKVQHSYYTRTQSNLHSKQLHDYLDGNHNELVRRSLLGLPKVYNRLPQSVVNAKSVSSFQTQLQHVVKEQLKKGKERWEQCLNLRQTAFSV